MLVRTNKPIPFLELRSALEGALSRHFGRKRRILCLRRRFSRYSSSFPIENVEVELEARQTLRLVVKDLSPESMLATARVVRPAFLYRQGREIEVYTSILRDGGLGTPVCYGAVQSEAERRYWLFLERVEGPLLWQVGSLQVWEEAARWLGRLHRQYQLASVAAEPGGLKLDAARPGLDRMLEYDEPLLRIWLARAEAFLRSRNGTRSRSQWRRFDRIANCYDRVIERLLAMPRTLIHGEFFPSNIIVRRGSMRFPICPIDWEVAGIGPGLLDLAALALGNWTEDQRARLIAAYRRAWRSLDGAPPSLSELSEAVSYCQLHLSIQLLGWASDWSPPERHARNWLGEASRLAAAVGM